MTKRATFVLPSGKVLQLTERKAQRKTAINKTKTKIQELLQSADSTRTTRKMTPEEVREQLRWNKDIHNAHNS